MTYMIFCPCKCISCLSHLCLRALAILVFFQALATLHMEFPLPRMLFPCSLHRYIFLSLSLNLEVTSSPIILNNMGPFTSILYGYTQSFFLIALDTLELPYLLIILVILITNLSLAFFLSSPLKI